MSNDIMRDMFCSIVGGFNVVYVGLPFDTIKTRMQTTKADVFPGEQSGPAMAAQRRSLPPPARTGMHCHTIRTGFRVVFSTPLGNAAVLSLSRSRSLHHAGRARARAHTHREAQQCSRTRVRRNSHGKAGVGSRAARR